MRCMDADAYVQYLKDAIKKWKYENLKIGGVLTVADVIGVVISDLDGTGRDGFKNAPTIHPDPCSVCRWKDEYKWEHCNECNAEGVDDGGK